MAQIDIYKNNVYRKKQDILKIHEDIKKEEKKITDFENKILNVKQAISRTKVESSIKSKHSEIQRYEKSISDIKKKIANLNCKEVQKKKELSNEENKVIREEEKINKKRIQEEEKINKKRIQEENKTKHIINTRLNKHETLHKETAEVISQITNLPEKINVLFIASNPIDQNQLRLDEEARAIMETIRKSDFRDSVNFKSIWAVRTIDLLQSINEYKPTIIHISGHGAEQGIVFQDNNGNAKLVRNEAIVQLINATDENIRVIFFNTCYSKEQAKIVVNCVEAAIGMNSTIGDEAARVFSAQFYSAIAFGKSIKIAFEQAKAALMLEDIPENNTPELFIKDNCNAQEIILVSK